MRHGRERRSALSSPQCLGQQAFGEGGASKDTCHKGCMTQGLPRGPSFTRVSRALLPWQACQEALWGRASCLVGTRELCSGVTMTLLSCQLRANDGVSGKEWGSLWGPCAPRRGQGSASEPSLLSLAGVTVTQGPGGLGLPSHAARPSDFTPSSGGCCSGYCRRHSTATATATVAALQEKQSQG